MSVRDIVLSVVCSYGGYRLGDDLRAWWRRRKLRRGFAEFHRNLTDIQTRFVSGVMATVRPDVPTTWREMVAAETGPVEPAPCDCPNCAARRATERRAVN